MSYNNISDYTDGFDQTAEIYGKQPVLNQYAPSHSHGSSSDRYSDKYSDRYNPMGMNKDGWHPSEHMYQEGDIPPSSNRSYHLMQERTALDYGEPVIPFGQDISQNVPRGTDNHSLAYSHHPTPYSSSHSSSRSSSHFSSHSSHPQSQSHYHSHSHHHQTQSSLPSSSPRQTIEQFYEDIAGYYTGIRFTKVENKVQENVSVYVAYIFSYMGKDNRYLIVICDLDQAPIGYETPLANLRWISFQTRTLSTWYNLESQEHRVPDNHRLNDVILRLDGRTEKYTSYVTDPPISVLLLHDMKRDNMYQWPDSLKLNQALETYQCSLRIVS